MAWSFQYLSVTLATAVSVIFLGATHAPGASTWGCACLCVSCVFFFGLVASNDMNVKDVNGGGWVVTSRWDPMAGLVVGMAGEG